MRGEQMSTLREWVENVSEQQLVVLGRRRRRRTRVKQGEQLKTKCSLCQSKSPSRGVHHETSQRLNATEILLWLHREIWIISYFPSLPPNAVYKRHVPCYVVVTFKQNPKAEHFQQFLGRNIVLVSGRKQYILFIHTYPQYLVTLLRYIVNWSPWLWSLYTIFKCPANSPETQLSENFLLCIILSSSFTMPDHQILSYIWFCPFTGHCSFWLWSEPVESVTYEGH